MDASFVDFDTMQAVPARTMARRMIDRCTPYAEQLGCTTQLQYVEDILANGSGAQRQRRVFEQTGDLRSVVRFLTEQASMVAA
jgi:carboxylate-amine ligase